MMNVKIYVPVEDLKCEDCSEILENTISEIEGIDNYLFNSDSISIEYDGNIIDKNNIIEALKDLGFEASISPLKKSSLKIEENREYDTEQNKKKDREYDKESGRENIIGNTVGNTVEHNTRHNERAKFEKQNFQKKESRIKTKIYIPDIECESCSKLLEKKMSHIDGVKDYAINVDSMDIIYDKEMINAEDLVTAVEDLGFRASVRPFERKSFSERFRDFRMNNHKYVMITKAFSYGFMAFVILLLLHTLAFIGFLNNNIPDFFGRYVWWLIYLDLSVAGIGATIWYMSSYKGTVTCMTGMMIGMTVGMQAGMMIGAVVGGTNGFFTGAMVGMTVAVLAGTLTGAVCGIMGAVQGMMSGVMAGTMGAMITVMMFTDHVFIFMPYYMIINIVILIGLIYLFYEEVVEGKKDIKKQSQDFITFVSACIVITAIITIIMIYGPKSPLFA